VLLAVEVQPATASSKPHAVIRDSRETRRNEVSIPS